MKLTDKELQKNKWIYTVLQNSPLPMVIRVIDIKDDLVFLNTYEEKEKVQFWALRDLKQLEWKYLPEVVGDK